MRLNPDSPLMYLLANHNTLFYVGVTLVAVLLLWMSLSARRHRKRSSLSVPAGMNARRAIQESCRLSLKSLSERCGRERTKAESLELKEAREFTLKKIDGYWAAEVNAWMGINPEATREALDNLGYSAHAPYGPRTNDEVIREMRLFSESAGRRVGLEMHN